MTTRSVIVLVVVTAALSGLFSFSLAAGGLHRGPQGPEGPPGPPGPTGRAQVTPGQVRRAVEEDPDVIAKALSGHLDYDDIQKNLELKGAIGGPGNATSGTGSSASATSGDAATQADVDSLRSDLDDLRRQVDTLCSDLARSKVASDIPSC